MFRQAVKDTVWPGRLETVSSNPAIVLDGAHNDTSLRVLFETLAQYFPAKKINLVFGVSEDKIKDIRFSSFSGLCKRIFLTKAGHPRAKAFTQGEAEKFFPGTEIILCSDVSDALDRAVRAAGPEEVLVVCGSLFLVSEARKILSNGKSHVSIQRS